MRGDEPNWTDAEKRFHKISAVADKVADQLIGRSAYENLVAEFDDVEVCALMNAIHDKISMRLWSAKRRLDRAKEGPLTEAPICPEAGT